MLLSGGFSSFVAGYCKYKVVPEYVPPAAEPDYDDPAYLRKDLRERLAVGDAALAFDPLSSQGLFNALYTGLRGAQAVHRALQGQQQALAPYLSVLHSVRQACLRQIGYHYQREQRWPDELFWQERNRHGRR